ncbi:hypothetical protein GCM10010327_11790 [Streptomyces nitrosporeus]|nr:hypothetical protein GCM10010327_11790 [Streptomyces nitrosporeus]
MVQKPSVRPGRSPRERPTGAPQSDREQNRFRSGTSGFGITAVRGSGRGTSGTSTSPAPSLLLLGAEPVEPPEARTDTERDVRVPDSERESRPETERRDVEEREDPDEDREEEREPDRCEPLPLTPPPATPVGGELSRPAPGPRPCPDGGPADATTGASPQVSQYSSPPPMSS